MTILTEPGDMLRGGHDAIVDPVNCRGASGAGVARLCARTFGGLETFHRQACRDGRIRIGHVAHYAVRHPRTSIRHVLLLPTKDDWRRPSRVEYIEQALPQLRERLAQLDIRDLGIPALGCGYGGLDWTDVEPILRRGLQGLRHTRIRLYPPQATRITRRARTTRPQRTSKRTSKRTTTVISTAAANQASNRAGVV